VLLLISITPKTFSIPPSHPSYTHRSKKETIMIMKGTKDLITESRQHPYRPFLHSIEQIHRKPFFYHNPVKLPTVDLTVEMAYSNSK
jgi:hypothetical protein